MASRRARGKKRYDRRRAHAVMTAGRPGLVAAVSTGKDGGKTVRFAIHNDLGTVVDRETNFPALAAPPSRSQCPECGSSQKVRRDGTMGKHTYGSEGRACAGTGRKWND